MSELMLAHTGDASARTSVSDAILHGYAKDGELYVPVEYPKFSDKDLYDLRGADYPTIFYEVTKKFLSGVISDGELRTIASEAYASELFDFDDGKLRVDEAPFGMYIAGLSDGPTGAFKDMAMQPFARIVEAIRRKKNIQDTLDILISTSGDTGPAAQHAFGSIGGVRTFTMFPQGEGASEFQRAQMIGMHDQTKTHSLEVAAGFTQINDMHMNFQNEFEVGAVNSVNIARLIAQVPYHVATYLRTIELSNKPFGDEIDISIPSGNFGSGLAAIIARSMGVPIRNIIVATNENDTLAQYFNTGVYPNIPKEDEAHTSSSAQDIRNASNWWRYADMVYGGRNDEFFETWKHNGHVDLSGVRKVNPEYSGGMKAMAVGELARHAMMLSVWRETQGKMMIDPHTANAMEGAKTFKDSSGVPMVAYETAKPFKFPKTINQVLGVDPVVPERFGDVIENARSSSVPHFNDEHDIREYLEEYNVRAKIV